MQCTLYSATVFILAMVKYQHLLQTGDMPESSSLCCLQRFVSWCPPSPLLCFSLSIFQPSRYPSPISFSIFLSLSHSSHTCIHTCTFLFPIVHRVKSVLAYKHELLLPNEPDMEQLRFFVGRFCNKLFYVVVNDVAQCSRWLASFKESKKRVHYIIGPHW